MNKMFNLTLLNVLHICAYVIILCSVYTSCAGYSEKFVSEERLVFKEGKSGKEALIDIGLTQTPTSISQNNNTAHSAHLNRKATVEITSPLLPSLTISGVTDGFTDNRIKIEVLQLSFLSNWPNGWTEGVYEASGIITLNQKNGTWISSVEDPFTIWDIKKGEIRYYDTYYLKDDGLKKVRNRFDRIKEVTRYLKAERQFPAFIGNKTKKTIYGKSMNNIVTPFLFPETVNFQKLQDTKTLPKEFSEKTSAGSNPSYTRGAEITWRTDYTDAVFPENLKQLRNSGTLWRDYEETPGLFLSLYNLEHITNTILPNAEFIKK